MSIENTRDILLQATLKLISEKGYLGATTRDIAREAGVTELTLFRHFGTKERLFEELLKNYTFLPKLKELVAEFAELGCDESLVLIARGFLLTLKERKALIKIFYQEVTNYPEKIREVYNRFLDEVRSTLADYFSTLQERGALKKDLSPDIAARAFLAMFFGYFRQEEIMRRDGMNKEDMENYIRQVVVLFLHGASE